MKDCKMVDHVEDMNWEGIMEDLRAQKIPLLMVEGSHQNKVSASMPDPKSWWRILSLELRLDEPNSQSDTECPEKHEQNRGTRSIDW